jgi:hypothetical protein
LQRSPKNWSPDRQIIDADDLGHLRCQPPVGSFGADKPAHHAFYLDTDAMWLPKSYKIRTLP